MSGTTGSMAAQAVQVVSSTWARDSHDLFDFESDQLQSKTFTVRQSATCIRGGANVEVAVEGAEKPVGAESLVRVVERSGTFWVDTAQAPIRSKKLWMVVRDVAPRGHRLRENDAIKLGRFKFRVRQLVGADHGDIIPDLGLDDSSTVSCPLRADSEMQSTCCRICLMEGPGEDGSDPLITPCMCKGSIEFVHLKCLRYWANSRLNLSENPLGSYFYRPLQCELCKTPYPTYVTTEKGRSPLMEVPKTQPPYIVLENMIRDARAHTRGLHVISLADKALMLGRGHESDVRIADVSISRCHATIRFQEGQFLLQDNGSKFGTLVAMKRPLQIEAAKRISLQIGRTVLSLSLTADTDVPGIPHASEQTHPLPVSAPSTEEDFIGVASGTAISLADASSVPLPSQQQAMSASATEDQNSTCSLS